MIGGALVGTFLGVFLAYGLVRPVRERRLKGNMRTQDHQFYTLIRDVLIANLRRHPPNICIEVGRQNAPRAYRPDFVDLEQQLRTLKTGAA